MSYFDITIDGELYALGWYGNCNWNGFLSERKISGFRLRKGNILIGDSKTLNGVFKEARFNGWTQGEIFITTDKLVPNARRDDFEQNEAYYQLIEALSNGVALDITRAIREASRTRNDPSAKALKDVDKKVSEATAFVVEGFNSSIDKERIVKELTETANKLEKIKVKDEFESKKNILKEKVDEVIEQVSESSNYKINKINSGIDKKSKHMLKTVSDILSKKLSKFLVDEIIDEIITELNGK
jgi:molecular chaperone HtpG